METSDTSGAVAGDLRLLAGSRYFRHVPSPLLARIVSRGRSLALAPGEVLIREGETDCRDLYVLLEGSLAVESAGRFILRLDRAGDIIGELALLEPTARSADVVAESASRLLAFTPELLALDDGADTVPVVYLMLTHILAAKLKLTTAQALLRKAERASGAQPSIALVGIEPADREAFGRDLARLWPQAAIHDAATFDDALALAQGKDLALCIVDLDCAGLAPASFVELLRSRGSALCFLGSPCARPAMREAYFAQGVSDCLARPLPPAELRHVLERAREWFYKNRELDRIERQADTDTLTGLATRRRLDEFLAALHTTFEDNPQPFSLVICDVDHFKHYNDRNGHPQGDAVLARVGRILQTQVRRGDLASRFGGEEFVLVLPNCPQAQAAAIANHLRERIAAEPFPHGEAQPLGRVSATFGVATYDGSGTIAGLLERADQCLYRGKRQGRNVVIAGSGAAG